MGVDEDELGFEYYEMDNNGIYEHRTMRCSTSIVDTTRA